VMDEPESALSFTGCLGLLSVLLDRLANGDSQLLLATHSPLLASLPGARVLEVGPWGLRSVPWEDLELVHHWRRFLEDPRRYHRHL
jgi:predicted ATPase